MKMSVAILDEISDTIGRSTIHIKTTGQSISHPISPQYQFDMARHDMTRAPKRGGQDSNLYCMSYLTLMLLQIRMQTSKQAGGKRSMWRESDRLTFLSRGKVQSACQCRAINWSFQSFRPSINQSVIDHCPSDCMTWTHETSIGLRRPSVYSTTHNVTSRCYKDELVANSEEESGMKGMPRRWLRREIVFLSKIRACPICSWLYHIRYLAHVRTTDAHGTKGSGQSEAYKA